MLEWSGVYDLYLLFYILYVKTHPILLKTRCKFFMEICRILKKLRKSNKKGTILPFFLKKNNIDEITEKCVMTHKVMEKVCHDP